MIATDSSLQEAKEQLSIPQLWAMLNLPGKPGRSCRSPFREDRNPSFSIYDHGRRWKDHATGEGGDAVDFLALALNLSNEDACRKLIEIAGLVPQFPHFPREEKHGSGDEMAEKARKGKAGRHLTLQTTRRSQPMVQMEFAFSRLESAAKRPISSIRKTPRK